MDTSIYECDGNFDTDNTLDCQLLVEIGANYYSYAVVNAVGKLKAIAYKNIPLLTNLDNEAILKLPFKDILISLTTLHFTFIPTEIFNQNQQTGYTKFLDRDPKNATHTHNLLNNQITALNTFNQNQFNAVVKVFHTAKILPQYLPFIENTFRQFKSILGIQLFLNVQLKSLELLILKEGQLQFYNTFKWLSHDEILYYALLACKKNGIKPQSVTLRVCGKIGLETAVYNQLNAVFSDIRLTKTNVIYVNSAEFKTIEPHKFFSLLSLLICE